MIRFTVLRFFCTVVMGDGTVGGMGKHTKLRPEESQCVEFKKCIVEPWAGEAGWEKISAWCQGPLRR